MSADDADLDRIEELLRSLEPDDLTADGALPEPPASVWSGIRAAAEPAAMAPTPLHRARRHRTVRRWGVAAAAPAVAAVAVGTIVVVRSGDDGGVVSSAVLSHPAGFDPRGEGARAKAELVERDGGWAIRLRDAQLPAVPGDDLELWLIEPDAAGQPVDVAPVSLVRGDGTYAVPAGLDPSSHFVVDISIEPRDGDHRHSGHSILRGPLEPT